ncbi:ATP-binding protein [Streptomyces tirandamycinicus]|uniref:ATP-binding protein n=2 Tax=Streptomyces tirandamycinicus TaxID=2174846 RepID=A0A2S1SYL0_9ACTN|nr:ATP-binding protein [Streptomyces tirandamycinicus]
MGASKTRTESETRTEVESESESETESETETEAGTASPLHEFAMAFTSSPRGARLARRLVSHRLDAWGHPYGSRVNDTLTLITAELTANAVRHGHVAGRDFRVRLTQGAAGLRVEVTDTRTERVPVLSDREPPGDAESGRGLLIVAGLATRWAVAPRAGAPGKTVWAELHLT